jgi:hypothetical protein
MGTSNSAGTRLASVEVDVAETAAGSTIGLDSTTSVAAVSSGIDGEHPLSSTKPASAKTPLLILFFLISTFFSPVQLAQQALQEMGLRPSARR